MVVYINGSFTTIPIIYTYTSYTNPLPINLSNATIYGANAEPGTVYFNETAMTNPNQNGTYYMTGSHFYAGDTSTYRPCQPFSVYSLPGGVYWQSRTQSNIYGANSVSITGLTINGVLWGDGRRIDYSGTTTTTLSNSTTITGEWVQIWCPYSFILKGYSITSRFTGSLNWYYIPNKWYILGINDTSGFTNNNPSTWNIIDSKNTDQYLNATLDDKNLPIYTISNSTNYNYYRIVFTSMCNGNNYTANAAVGLIKMYV